LHTKSLPTQPIPIPGGLLLTRQRVTTAYSQLRELIVTGRLRPGARLIETDLALRLGFSRTPVRGALRVLRSEGYVHAVDGGKRTRLVVAPLSAADARELFGLVGALEGLAALAASALPRRPRLQLAAELRGFDAALLIAAAQSPPDCAEIFDLFARFHLRYMEVVGGPRLRALHGIVKPQAERYRRLYSLDEPEGRVAASVAEHAEIIEGIEQGDGPGARAAVERHWRNAAERVGELIEATGSQAPEPVVTGVGPA
jgi:DNA-binding GntR family transcriptional regulator